MPAKEADYFIQHPTVPTKETCKSCLTHLKAKKIVIEQDETLRSKQKHSELQKKDSQSEWCPGTKASAPTDCVLGVVRRLYWKTGQKAERTRHLATCAHQPKRVREAAKQARNKKADASVPLENDDDGPGPMSHFKEARANPKPRPRPQPLIQRPSRASSSTATTSYAEDTDDEAFEALIADAEHQKYLQDKKDEEERAERRRLAQLEREKKAAEVHDSDDEPLE
jgi:hypothetical protein